MKKFLWPGLILALILGVLIAFVGINPFDQAVLDQPNQLIALIFSKILKVSGITSFSDLDFWFHTGLVVLVSVLTLLFELAVLGWEKSSLKKIFFSPSKSTKNDIFGWLIDMFNLYDFLTFLLSFGILHAFSFFVKQIFDLSLILNIESAVVQYSIIFIVGDLKNYVRHRFSHQWEWFWQLHKYHHSATEFNMIAHRRSHFIESAVSKIFDVIPYVILGAPIQSYFIVKLIHESHQMMLHSDLNWKWGWVGKYLLVSPAAHKIHHSVEEKHFNTNYGGTFIVWDRLFGTYYEPEEVPSIGIPNNPFNKKNYISDIFLAYKDFLSALYNLVFKKRGGKTTPR